MSGRPRIDAARKRANVAKRTVTVTAAAAFVTALALVRLGHPATATTPTAGNVQQARSSYFSGDREDGSTFGGGSIAPASSATPPVATATS